MSDIRCCDYNINQFIAFGAQRYNSCQTTDPPS